MQQDPSRNTETVRRSSDADDSALNLTSRGLKDDFKILIISVLCNQILHVLQEIQNYHNFTRNIHVTDL